MGLEMAEVLYYLLALKLTVIITAANCYVTVQ